jgi:hypothetical protein
MSKRRYLITSELDPPLVVELLVELIKNISIQKVDKAISYVAIVLN